MNVVDTYGDYVTFKCPGCNLFHDLRHKGEGRPMWSFNGDKEKPTLTPSILYTSGHYVQGYNGGSCWCEYRKENPDCVFECVLCHSFVTDGHIRFLEDSTHKYAGQTLKLPPYQRESSL